MSRIYIRSKQLRGVTTVKIDGQCYYPSTTKIGLNEQPLTDISQAEAFYVGDCDTCDVGSITVGCNQAVTLPLSSLKDGKQFTMSTPPLCCTRVLLFDDPPNAPLEIQLDVNGDVPGRFNPGNVVLDPLSLGSGPTIYSPPQELPQTKTYTKLPNNDIKVTLISTDPFVITVKKSAFKTVDPLPDPTHGVTPDFLSTVESGKTNTDDLPIEFSVPSDDFPGPTAIIIPPAGSPITTVTGPGTFTACPGCTIYTGPGGSQPETETPPTGSPATVSTTGSPPIPVAMVPDPLSTITNIIVNNTTPPKPMVVELCEGQDGVVVHLDGSTTKYAKPRPADPTNPVMVTLNPGEKLVCGTLTDIEELPNIQLPTPGTITVGPPPVDVQVSPTLDPVVNPPIKNGGGDPIITPYGEDGMVVCQDGSETLYKGPGVLTLEPGCILIQGKISGVTEILPPDDGTITVGTPPTTIVVEPAYLDPMCDPPPPILKNETDPPVTIMMELDCGSDGIVVCDGNPPTITGHRGPGPVPVPPGCQLIQGVCTSLCDSSASTSLWDAAESNWNEFNSTWN